MPDAEAACREESCRCAGRGQEESAQVGAHRTQPRPQSRRQVCREAQRQPGSAPPSSFIARSHFFMPTFCPACPCRQVPKAYRRRTAQALSGGTGVHAISSLPEPPPPLKEMSFIRFCAVTPARHGFSLSCRLPPTANAGTAQNTEQCYSINARKSHRRNNATTTRIRENSCPASFNMFSLAAVRNPATVIRRRRRYRGEQGGCYRFVV